MRAWSTYEALSAAELALAQIEGADALAGFDAALAQVRSEIIRMQPAPTELTREAQAYIGMMGQRMPASSPEREALLALHARAAEAAPALLAEALDRAVVDLPRSTPNRERFVQRALTIAAACRREG